MITKVKQEHLDLIKKIKDGEIQSDETFTSEYIAGNPEIVNCAKERLIIDSGRITNHLAKLIADGIRIFAVHHKDLGKIKEMPETFVSQWEIFYGSA